MKIAIAGVGYVGLSLATLLSQYNEVVALDIIKDKVDKINSKIKKPDIENAKKANKTKREIDVEKHLYSTCKLVGKLNNNDLQMIENVMKTREINEEQKEKDI